MGTINCFPPNTEALFTSRYEATMFGTLRAPLVAQEALARMDENCESRIVRPINVDKQEAKIKMVPEPAPLQPATSG